MRVLKERKIRLWILSILAVFVFYSMEAQNEKNLIAKLNYEKNDGSNIIRGWFLNNQTLPAVFQYVFTVTQKDTSLVARNSFRAGSGQKVALSKATFFFKNGDDIEKVKLEIFRYGKMVAGDSINFKAAEKRIIQKGISPQNTALESETDPIEDLEIDGLIIDETRSKIGHDFYEYFYNNWVAPANAKGFIITVRELPARGRGAQIVVEVNDQTLTKRFLQPRNDLIEETATYVVGVVKNHLVKMKNLQNQILTEDLKGSGIH